MSTNENHVGDVIREKENGFIQGFIIIIKRTIEIQFEIKVSDMPWVLQLNKRRIKSNETSQVIEEENVCLHHRCDEKCQWRMIYSSGNGQIDQEDMLFFSCYSVHSLRQRQRRGVEYVMSILLYVHLRLHYHLFNTERIKMHEKSSTDSTSLCAMNCIWLVDWLDGRRRHHLTLTIWVWGLV